MNEGRHHVAIVGGGVAAVEALLALHELAAHRVRITLVSPEREFVYHPGRIAGNRECHFWTGSPEVAMSGINGLSDGLVAHIQRLPDRSVAHAEFAKVRRLRGDPQKRGC
jgi:hypothetical protein